MPMPVMASETAEYRWQRKPVAETRLLDDMESTDSWSHHGYGQMALVTDRFKDGSRALRLSAPTVGEKPNPVVGRPFGEAAIRREFPGEDWSAFNRLSVWVYPRLPGFKTISILLKLRNDGAVKVPDRYNREGLHYVLLKPDRWNRVVWEIPHLARDKVTALDLIYRLQGSEPGATNQVVFYFDHLELQTVAADPYEGWDVVPGRIAYSQSGYLPQGRKVALASGLAAQWFSVVDARTQRTLLHQAIALWDGVVGTNTASHAVWTATRRTNATTVAATPAPAALMASPAVSVTRPIQVMDFSALRAPGTYYLAAGGVRTRLFAIQTNAWHASLWKTVNFFYGERCGTAIRGIHDLCHRDWRAEHDGRSMVINGGWHDAGDLSQGLVNTAEAAYAMLDLADTLARTGDKAMSRRVEEEARWGLDWVLKTRFGDGARVTWATMDYWTDNRPGTVDDTLGEVRDSPYENFVAAATQARAARFFAATDSRLAAKCLEAARQDFAFASDKLGEPGVEMAAGGGLAALELFLATREPAFAERAVRLGQVVVESQAVSFRDWPMPLTGYYYTSPKKERLLHYAHRGHEQAPTVLLAGLCRALPRHSDWMRWYAAVALHSEYLRQLAAVTEPYGMLAASIYRIDESDDPHYRAQVENGIRLDARHYLRRFPVWFDFRGNHGTLLSQAKALAAAARLRPRPDLMDVAQRQLQWAVGLNPFAQSTMFGEGHDYAPQYSALSGDLVGSLPVGIQTREDADAPYWPAANCYNYKEVWVHPSSRWLWILSDVLAPPPPSSAIPAGPDAFRFVVATERGTADSLDVVVRMRAAGPRRFELRSHNLECDSPVLDLQPDPRQGLAEGRWHCAALSTNAPWIALIVPEGKLAEAKELVGGYPGH
jgi:hypothetical protein